MHWKNGLKKWLFSIREARIKAKQKRKNEIEKAKEEWEDNPYLFCFRYILEQILEQKDLTYKKFSPVLIDEKKDNVFALQEDIWVLLEQIERDLNALTIITDRPEEFYAYGAKMQEENGLLVDIRKKEKMGNREFLAVDGNVIIDLEKDGHFCTMEKKAGYVYIPIYKVPWQKGDNLDIIVPIGYNTVIVKGVTSGEETTNSVGS